MKDVAIAVRRGPLLRKSSLLSPFFQEKLRVSRNENKVVDTIPNERRETVAQPNITRVKDAIDAASVLMRAMDT